MGKFSDAVKKMVGLKAGRLFEEWGFDSNASIIAPPSIADIDGDGKPEIILGTKEGKLIVLDFNAKVLWSYAIDETMDSVEEMFLDQEVMKSINSAPVIANLYNNNKQFVLFGSEMGVMYCLDHEGKLIWKFNTDGGIRGSPVVADVNGDGKPEVIFGCLDKFLYILDSNGKLIERFEQASPIESTPGVFEDKIIFGTNDGLIVALKSNGEELWSFQTHGKITAEPSFGRLTKAPVDYVLIGSTDNNLYCLDVDGELVWTYETQGAIYSKATIANLKSKDKKEIIIGSCDNNVHAISSDGDKLWTFETDFWVVSSPLVVDIDDDGRPEIIVGSYDHNIYILDSEGAYILDYMPGLSGVVQQTGHYSDIMTKEPGEHVGKKLWQFKTSGVVVGCAQLGEKKNVIVATKVGKVNNITHKR